jgi:hypothetical protein
MKQIDHVKHEKRPGYGVYWFLAAFLLLSGATYFLTQTPDWWGICLGGGVVFVITTWAIEITGNKAPDWMSPRPRRRP